jgi:tetratricopeptide (TPR) repeat protein
MYYTKAINQEPNDWQIWEHKGHALKKLGNDIEAKICYDKAKEVKESNGLGRFVVSYELSINSRRPTIYQFQGKP